MIREYKFPLLEKVIHGPGALARVPEEMDRLGKKRAFLLTGSSLSSKTDLVVRLQQHLGNRLFGTFSGCRQHVPRGTVNEAVERARECRADLLLSLGGGSVIDAAKMTTLYLLGDRPHGTVAHIAVPTTLSASEFTPFAGMTDSQTGVKSVCRDSRVVPGVAILDPEMTLATPAELWAATGIKALDHAIEALWSVNAHIVTDALAMEAIRTLRQFLPASLADPADLDARQRCQTAAWLSIFGLANVGVRLSHIIGHQIGSHWNVPHGVTSCIVLAPCMRFLAPQTLDRQFLIAQCFGIPTTGRSLESVANDAADAVQAFIASFGLPQRLRDVGVRESEVSKVADAVIEESGLWHKQQLGNERVLNLLLSMW